MTTRKTTPDEESLFRETLKDAKPVEQRKRVVLKTPAPERLPLVKKPELPPRLETPAPVIGGHRSALLRRGKLEPEARIDLHGFSQDDAYAQLLPFLQRAHASGKRLLLVITGKGRILRAQLPLWLGQKDLQGIVSGISEAHVEHGGAGAFYVALRAHKDRR